MVREPVIKDTHAGEMAARPGIIRTKKRASDEAQPAFIKAPNRTEINARACDEAVRGP